MASQIQSVSNSRSQIIELIKQYGTDQKRSFEVLFTNPLNCENLLNLLLLTTAKTETQAEHLSLLDQYDTVLQGDTMLSLITGETMDLHSIVSDMIPIRDCNLTLPQLTQGTQTILSYLQAKAHDLIFSVILPQIEAIGQENPDLLLSYQKMLKEISPYLFQNTYPTEVQGHLQDYINYMTLNPSSNASSTKIQEDLSTPINDINNLHEGYINLYECSLHLRALKKEITALTAHLYTSTPPDPEAIYLWRIKTLQIETFEQEINKLTTELPSLPNLLMEHKNLLIHKDSLGTKAKTHEELLERLSGQIQILRFFFSVYNSDVCMKKILILNKPNQLQQSLRKIESLQYTTLNDDTNKIIKDLFDVNKQEVQEASELLGVPLITQQIKDSEFAQAVDGWLTNLDGMIFSIEKDEATVENLTALFQDLHTIIEQSEPAEEDDATQASLILQQLETYITELTNSQLNWSQKEHTQFLTNEIKAPLEKLIKPQIPTLLDDVIAQLDQLAANIRSS